MQSGNKVSMLPIEMITAKLLNQVAKVVIEMDKNYQNVEPPWWKHVCLEVNKAARENTEDGISAIINSSHDFFHERELVDKPCAVIPSIMLKAMVIGWRMAECALTDTTDRVLN
jgi:hypothetical protein